MVSGALRGRSSTRPMKEAPVEKHEALGIGRRPDRTAVRQGRHHALGERGARRSPRSRPARSRSTSRSGSGGSRAGAHRDLRPRVLGKTTLASTSSPRRSAWAASARSSMPSMRSTRLCRALGVDVDELLISQPDSGEQALEIAEALVRSGAFDVVVDRLGRGAGAEGRARGRHGRHARRPPGPADVARRCASSTGTLNRTGTSASSPTSSGRRSGSCSAPPRPPRAAGR